MQKIKSSFTKEKYKCSLIMSPNAQPFNFNINFYSEMLSLKLIPSSKYDKKQTDLLFSTVYPFSSKVLNQIDIHYSLINQIKFNANAQKFQLVVYNPKIKKNILFYIFKIELVTFLSSKANTPCKNIRMFNFLSSEVENQKVYFEENFYTFLTFLKKTLVEIANGSFLFSMEMYQISKKFYEQNLNNLIQTSKQTLKTKNLLASTKNELKRIIEAGSRKIIDFDNLYIELIDKASKSVAMTILFVLDMFNLTNVDCDKESKEEILQRLIEGESHGVSNIVKKISLRRKLSFQNHSYNRFENDGSFRSCNTANEKRGFSLISKRHNSGSTKCSGGSEEENENVETPRFNSEYYIKGVDVQSEISMKKNLRNKNIRDVKNIFKEDKSERNISTMIEKEKANHVYLPPNSIENIDNNTVEFIHRKYCEQIIYNFFPIAYGLEKDNHDSIKLDSLYDYYLIIKEIKNYLSETSETKRRFFLGRF